MTCCSGTLAANPERRDLSFWAVEVAPGRHSLDLIVPDARCAACIGTVERAVGGLPGVERARLNLSAKRLSVTWSGALTAEDVAATLSRHGYRAVPVSPDETRDKDPEGAELVRALAVAGFAAANVMLLSVSVWAGAEGATRELFHWISALIALPAVAYAVRPFARSALRALSAGRTNMDVPITLAVVLAAVVSLRETAAGEMHVYFDASVSLLFFLLLGRTLDHVMRRRARSAAATLVAQSARAVSVVEPDGSLAYRAVNEVAVGDRVRVAAGERFALDGTVVEGVSAVDASIVTGESEPIALHPGDTVLSGAINLSAPVTVTVRAAAGDGFLAKIARLMEEAEFARGRYVRVADRASRAYAPVVHLLALFGFIGWLAAGADWHQAMMVAIATLIITCPCALGLAVPAVGTVASDILFRRGILLKDGAALERLAEVETVVFDKTGTLTTGAPRLVGTPDPEALTLAAALAAHSRHPLSRAIVAIAPPSTLALTDVAEHPGDGLSGRLGDGRAVRLGRIGWASEADRDVTEDATALVLSVDDRVVTTFLFTDEMRVGSREAVDALAGIGIAVAMLSGDRPTPVRRLAERLGIDRWWAGSRPDDKVTTIERLKADGPVLVVGDGLNDGPALRAASVGMAPADASDLGRASADLIFLRESLTAVPQAIAVSRAAMRHVRQNFVLAIGYNALAVPLALAGFVTPLVAALAMSTSSIIVVLNALRLGLSVPRDADTAERPTRPRLAERAA